TLDRADVLGWAARTEAGSEHPLAPPVIAAAAAEGLPVAGLPEATEPVPGKGVAATLECRRVVVGNLALLTADAIAGAAAAPALDELAAAGRPPMAVARDGRVVGVLAVADRLRP